MDTRHVYAVGCGLGLVGSVLVVVGLALAGLPAIGAIALGSTFVFALTLVNVFRREDFDRDHSPAYRLGNLGGAVLTVVLGLVTLAAGVFSVVTFG
jgi:hypothetical protein